jgi:hypothetical protein
VHLVQPHAVQLAWFASSASMIPIGSPLIVPTITSAPGSM